MTKNHKSCRRREHERDENAKVLAWFWRYGYFLLFLALIWLSSKCTFLPPYVPLLLLVSMFLIFGIWTVVAAAQWRRHFVYGMQNAAHRRMGGYRAKNIDKKIQREGIIIGSFFSLLSLALIVMNIRLFFR